MTIANTKVVDTTSKYIVQSKGIGSETDQIVVDAENLTSGNNKSLSKFDRMLLFNRGNRYIND